MQDILLCLATRKGLESLREVVALRPDCRVFVCTFKETNVLESFDDQIAELARDAGFENALWTDLRGDPVGFLSRRNIGSILCVGWRFLVPLAAVQHLNGQVIVAHDSLLPKLRGFAPLPTAMITGEIETGVTFLRAGPGIDDGDVLWQTRVPILATDSIGDLIDRVAVAYRAGVRRLLSGESCGGTPQDHSQATYSIWRDASDYRIDWTADAVVIERTIRALGRPYLGAQCYLGTNSVVLNQAEVVSDICFAIRQPGKIWSLDSSGCPTVVCGNGLLKIRSATSNGRSLLPLTVLRQQFT